MNDNNTINSRNILECENKELEEKIAFYQKENECLKAEITDLKSADSKIIAEPIKVAENLIYAEYEYELDGFAKAFTNRVTGTERAYSKSNLRQIAEHLLVYCNSAEE